ncbi:MAG: MBL fold metallo-hydrolase [Candidatus Nanoarchaeia archaeon]|nr:MBL fold metallo-hydrolase [Candidatus Nanoarchaeia archaeon]
MGNKYLEWIGTGSGLNFTLGNTSFLIKGGERILLVDCGYTVPLELMKSGQLKDITDVILTHTHADHIGGIEGFAYMNYFAFKKREDQRPNLYIATEKFAQRLWNNSLKGGLEKIQDEENIPQNVTLDTYFKIHIGKQIDILGLPTATLFPASHVQGMENYGVSFDNGVWYSGDSLDLPKNNSKLIFQDCQFYETIADVHVSYNRLKQELSPDVKAKTYLVHLGGGWEQKNPKADGFAGFVMPKQRFDLESL